MNANKAKAVLVPAIVGLLSALTTWFTTQAVSSAPASASATVAPSGAATAGQVAALQEQVGRIESKLNEYSKRTDAVELWKAGVEAVERARARDAFLRERGR